MTGTVEQRAAALLRELLAERGKTAAELASEMGAAGEAVRGMLTGENGIQLDGLDGVLSALGVRPAAFFGRLYGPPDPAPPAAASEPASAERAGTAEGTEEAVRSSPEDEPISRREVEELLGELRSTIHGMVRLIDAERESAAANGDGEES